MDEKLLIKDSFLSSLLDGGFEKGIITTVYGPASSGKTTICMLSSISCVNSGKKVLFVDSERGFSINRFSQLSPDFKKILESIIFFNPSDFEDQHRLVSQLEKVINNVGLIIVDTISFLYRIAIANRSEIKRLNNILISQMGLLQSLASRFNIPIIISSQVYSSFEEKDKVNIVGGEILKFASKCLIELSPKKAILEKHRSIPFKEVEFKITGEGFKHYSSVKSSNL